MHTPFANCTPNATFNPTPIWNTGNGTPLGFQNWNQHFNQGSIGGWNQNGFQGFTPIQPNTFGHTPFPTPYSFWNQPAPFGAQPFSGYGYGPNGWWFGNAATFGTPFTGAGYTQPWNTTHSNFTGQPPFQNGFQNGFNQWGSATTPWFANTPAFQPHFANTPFSNTTFSNTTPWNTNTWQPLGTPFGTLHNQHTASFPFGTSPWSQTGFGWNTPNSFNTTPNPFGQISSFALNTTGGYTPNFAPNFTPTQFTAGYAPNYSPAFTPSNGNWQNTMPSYTGTPENFVGTPGSYSQSPVSCNGRDAA